MSVVILQDELVHYEVLGRGRPLLFLHGWVGSWRYWVPTMQAASIQYRTYALDLWGFGDSAKKAENYTLEQQVNLINLFMQEMGISKLAIIGHGLGAVVAILFAQRYSNLVDRLMAVGLPGTRHTLNPRLFNDSPADLADWLFNRTPEGEAARTEASKTDQKAIQFSLASLQRLDISNLAASLTTPCLLVYGQNDPLVLEDSSATTPLDTPEHIHQIVFDQSGHFPMLEEMNKFNRLLVDFLSLGSGVSPRQLQLKEEWRRRVR